MCELVWPYILAFNETKNVTGECTSRVHLAIMYSIYYVLISCLFLYLCASYSLHWHKPFFPLGSKTPGMILQNSFKNQVSFVFKLHQFTFVTNHHIILWMYQPRYLGDIKLVKQFLYKPPGRQSERTHGHDVTDFWVKTDVLEDFGKLLL